MWDVFNDAFIICTTPYISSTLKGKCKSNLNALHQELFLNRKLFA
jgi:hypothetical protein